MQADNFLVNNTPFLRLTDERGDSLIFLLDMGSAQNVVDSRIAKKFKHKTRFIDTSRFQTAGNDTLLWLHSGYQFFYEGQKLPEQTYVHANLKQILPFVDGVLGFPFLQDRRFLIDYPKQRIDFVSDDYNTSGKGFDSLYFKLSGGLVIIDADLQLNDTLYVSGDFIADTGFSGALMYFDTENDTIMASYKAKREIRSVSDHANLSGGSRSTLFRIKRFQAANLFCDSPYIYKMYKPHNNIKAESSGKLKGLLGNQLFSDYILLWDYPARKLYYKRLQASNPTGNALGIGIGIGLSPAGLLEVTSLIVPSPASEAGIQIGDRLDSVDSTEIEFDMYLPVFLLTKSAGNHSFSFSRNDSAFTVKLKGRRLI